MKNIKELAKKSIWISLWMTILTFPVMVIKVNTITDTIHWKWGNLIFVLLGTYLFSVGWNYLLMRRDRGDTEPGKIKQFFLTTKDRITVLTKEKPKVKTGSLVLLAAVVVIFPFVAKLYHNQIMITGMLYVILGLGLNIIVGLGGILNLGYIAFYAVGAYTYALLNLHYDISFWLALPLGGLFACIAGILIAIPVLRLSGDYLAIITLAFGEITRIILENWGGLSGGPSGIRNIPRPSIPGIEMNLAQATQFTYFLALAITLIIIFVTIRLRDSRIGRALVAMREDNIASESMGINPTRTKIIAFAIGATIAGVAGVLFASKTTFISPKSFTLWQSVIVLCSVVLGGMGSIPGVIIAALIMSLFPEFLRAFSEYRMIIFGAVLVFMMVFKPEGLIPEKRKHYTFKKQEAGE